MLTYSPRQWALASALFCGIFAVICYFWQYALSDPALAMMHMDMLRITFPGFTGMNAASFVTMLVESLACGFIFGWLFAVLLNLVKR